MQRPLRRTIWVNGTPRAEKKQPPVSARNVKKSISQKKPKGLEKTKANGENTSNQRKLPKSAMERGSHHLSKKRVKGEGKTRARA